VAEPDEDEVDMAVTVAVRPTDARRLAARAR
jgi:hypothetical protein